MQGQCLGSAAHFASPRPPKASLAAPRPARRASPRLARAASFATLWPGLCYLAASPVIALPCYPGLPSPACLALAQLSLSRHDATRPALDHRPVTPLRLA